jgi:soluble lytic murein transglycosylase-like protein
LKRLLLALVMAAGATPERAEIAVLASGEILKVSAHREESGRVYLTLKGGGDVDVPSDVVRAFVPDEILDDLGTAEGPGDLAALVRDVAKKRGLSPDLVLALVKVESGFQTNAVSPKGAKGLMQLMPGTAARLGCRDPMDPVQNVEAGTAYLRSLLVLYHGDKKKALAAYNAGERAVEAYGGVPPYKETEDYVKSILAIASRRP